MNIAIIGLRMVPEQFRGVSGVEVRGKIIIDLLLKKSHKIYVFVRRWANTKKLRRYRSASLISMPTIKHAYFDTFIYGLVSSILVVFAPSEVVLYESTGSAFFSFIPKLFGKKIIFTIHALEWKRRKWNIWAITYLKMSEWIGVFCADAIITVSPLLEQYIKDTYDKAVFCIPLFFEKKKPLLPRIITDKYGLHGNDYLLYLGRFVPEKRLELLIKAYMELKPGQKLVLAGGSSHSSEYVKYLLQLSSKNKRIIFTDYVFGREKGELLSNCIGFVNPSELEGMSIVIREALEYGKQILINDIPENRLLVKNEAFLFKTTKRNDLKKKLGILLSKKHIHHAEDYRLENYISKKCFIRSYEAIIDNT